MRVKQPEIKLLYGLSIAVLIGFLVLPMAVLLQQAFVSPTGFGLSGFANILNNERFFQAFQNSLLVSIATALVATSLAFVVAYAVNMTNIPQLFKQTLHVLVQLPMLLPTITYGFVLIYTFGKQGLLTQLLDVQIFSSVYGFNGLLLGYTIYTLPICYLLLNNAFKYLDKQLMVVSLVMQDSAWRRFLTTLLRPLLATLAAAMVQAFFLSFTDYGIPASVGGRFEVVASLLYQQMLGSNPSFSAGAVIAIMMLLPSIVSIVLLQYLSRFNVASNTHNQTMLPNSRWQSTLIGLAAGTIVLMMVGIFAVMFIAPFTSSWPYDLSFSSYVFKDVLSTDSMMSTYQNSVTVALLSAFIGTFICFFSALSTTRSDLTPRSKAVLQALIVITNTIPGMVLGIAYLLIFSGSSLHNTLIIMVLCNIVHFFSTPYLMAKDALGKMNHNWEHAASLMGDSWLQTLMRVILPNVKHTLLEIFSYLFINAMVTVSAVIFIIGAHTMVLTTKIKELQHFAKFDEIFILSIMILFTNLTMLAAIHLIKHISFSLSNKRRETARIMVCKTN